MLSTFLPLSFNLESGEILGIVGLLGSGKSEIAKALFGIDLAGATRITRLTEVYGGRFRLSS